MFCNLQLRQTGESGEHRAGKRERKFASPLDFRSITVIQLVELRLGRQVQSSIGFTACKAKELDLGSVVLPERSIEEHENAEACLGNHDLQLTADNLRVAEWNVVAVKKAIKVVGKTKTKRFS